MTDNDLVDQMGGGHGRAPQRMRFDESHHKEKTVTFEMVLHHETPSCIWVSLTGYERDQKDIGKSPLKIVRHSETKSAVKTDGQRTVLPVVTVTAPEWLAKDKGLI